MWTMMNLVIHCLLLVSSEAFFFGLPFGQHFGPSFNRGFNPTSGPYFGQNVGPQFGSNADSPFGAQFGPPNDHGFPPSFERPPGPMDMSFPGSNWPQSNGGFNPMGQPTHWGWMDHSNQQHQQFPHFQDNWMTPPDQPSDSMRQHSNPEQLDQFNTLNTFQHAWGQGPSGELVVAKENSSVKQEATYNPALEGDEKGTWKTAGNKAIFTLRQNRKNYLIPEKRYKFSDFSEKNDDLKLDDVDLKFSTSNLHDKFNKPQIEKPDFRRTADRSNTDSGSDRSALRDSRPQLVQTIKHTEFDPVEHRQFVNYARSRRHRPRLYRISPRHRRGLSKSKSMDEYEIIEERPFEDDQFRPSVIKFIPIKGRRKKNRRHLKKIQRFPR